MDTIRLQWARALAGASALTLSIGCAGEPITGLETRNPTVPSVRREPVSGIIAPAAARAVDLGSCSTLAPPSGSALVLHVHAQGVQIYHWNGAAWIFDGPSAVLSANAGGQGVIGTHYAGPTWASVSGGTVVGAVLDRCTADPDAVPWLLLSATPDGPGILHRVAYIQRVNTVGGNAPPTPGTANGQEARVPYTAEYLFYRAGRAD